MSEWAKAFVGAQAEMPEITKAKSVTVRTKTGGSYEYSYADLPTIVEKVRPHLAKHGLAVAQNVETIEGALHVTTIVHHSSGEKEEFGPIIFPGGHDAQSAGSAITYARRYSLCAALNIAADDDDDGQQASKNSAGSDPVPAKARGSKPQAAPATASPPRDSEGVSDVGAQQPSQAAPVPGAPSDQSPQQRGGTDGKENGASGEVGMGNSAPLVADGDPWTIIHAAVGRGTVKEVKVRIAAARLCSDREDVAIPQKYEDIKNCPPDVLEELAAEIRAKEEAAA